MIYNDIAVISTDSSRASELAPEGVSFIVILHMLEMYVNKERVCYVSCEWGAEVKFKFKDELFVEDVSAILLHVTNALEQERQKARDDYKNYILSSVKEARERI